MKGAPGKVPCFQFYVKDWLSDPQLRLTSPSTRGIWIDLLCFMWSANERGRLRLSKDQIGKLTGATNADVETFIIEAENINFCDIGVTNNGIVTLKNRRMIRENKYRESNRLRQQRHRDKTKSNANVTVPSQPAPSPSPSPNANIIKKPAPADAFSVPDNEILKEASEPMIEENIELVCSKLIDEKIFERARAFKTTFINKGKNKRAILHALSRTYMKKEFEKGPWAYAKYILSVENGNYNETDHQRTIPPIGR